MNAQKPHIQILPAALARDLGEHPELWDSPEDLISRLYVCGKYYYYLLHL